MSSERWKQVKTIFHESLRKDGADRDAYLDKVCGDDVDLRIEVESLLISLNEAQSFLETPLIRTSARSYPNWQLSEGQEISHYKILRPIGAGGMGEVYLAEDKTLHRPVALKLLPQSMVADCVRLRRFHREALAVSALNHPNILTIFEADSIDGTYLFAAEYVNGETLRERLKQRSLTLEETLDISMQIVSALQAAHNAGIVHRDIKPENIMIRDDGYVKVLDFGLAKLTADAPNGGIGSQLISNPSTLMGTASYMSPEQVRGHPTDTRSDIFSFGVVLYEMLCGRQAFTGDTNTDVIAAIIQRNPDRPTLTAPALPHGLEAVVNRCLEKERIERFQTAEELLAELGRLKREISEPAQPSQNGQGSEAAAAPVANSGRLINAAAIILLVLILAAIFYGLMFR